MDQSQASSSFDGKLDFDDDTLRGVKTIWKLFYNVVIIFTFPDWLVNVMHPYKTKHGAA